jgi:hypothetical protein
MTTETINIINEKASKLLAELADLDSIVEGGWLAYELITDLRNTSEIQRNECHKAFFFGAQYVFSSLMSVLPGNEPTKRYLDRISKINAELEYFIQELKAKEELKAKDN